MMLYAITLLGCTTYSSPVFSIIWWMRPLPDKVIRPRPETVVLPQCARLLVGQRHASHCPVNLMAHHLHIHARFQRKCVSSPC